MNARKENSHKNKARFNVIKRDRIIDLLTYLILSLCAAAVIFPFLYTFRTSIAPKGFTFEIPPKWIFKPVFTNYLSVFSSYNFSKYLVNSVLIGTGATLIGIPIAASAAYGISRFNIGGGSVRFGILIPCVFPPIVLTLPLFVIFQHIGLLDEQIGLVLIYVVINSPLLIWMLISFFDGLPVEMEEAALIDGASRLKALFYIILPLSAPGIMAAAILNFILSWNEFLFALILTAQRSGTITLILGAMNTQRGVAWGELAAGTTLGIFPALFLSLSIRKYLIHGLAFGALK